MAGKVENLEGDGTVPASRVTGKNQASNDRPVMQAKANGDLGEYSPKTQPSQ